MQERIIGVSLIQCKEYSLAMRKKCPLFYAFNNYEHTKVAVRTLLLQPLILFNLLFQTRKQF